MRNFRQWLLVILVAIVFTLVGFFVAVTCRHGFTFKADLTMDGLMAAVMAGLAVLAATIILPLWIQPQLHRQREVNKALTQDVVQLLSLIEDLLTDYEVKHNSGSALTVKDRQTILAKHKKINNIARVINQQAKSSPAIKDFESKVYTPLTQSQGEFSDRALPRKKLDAATYLSVKSALDPITYELQEIRYKLL